VHDAVAQKRELRPQVTTPRAPQRRRKEKVPTTRTTTISGLGAGTVVANRDEPTVYSFSQIVVYALVGARRPRHLSRLSTYMTTRFTLTSHTSRRGRDGNSRVQPKALGVTP
jgi:hypothetical protein